MKNFLKSKSFFWIASGLLVLLVISSGQKIYKRYLIEQEISKLQEEITVLEKGNDEIINLINYFKTPEFKERQARSLLSLQKPGEFAVALPPRDDADSETSEAEKNDEQKVSNLNLWWEYFFGNERNL